MAENETPAQHSEHKEGLGSVLAGFFGEHKTLLIGGIIGVAVVAFVLNRSQNASSAGTATNQQGSLAGAQTDNTASALDQLTSTLNNFLSSQQSTSGGAQSTNPPTGGGTGTLPSTGWHAPLIQQGAWPSNFQWKFGQKVSVGGTTYTVGPGSGGIIWGVPGTGWTQSNWDKVPVGPGGKVAVYGTNPADYVPPTLNPQANHSPMITALTLSQNAASMTDLSHAGPGGGTNMAWSPVARNGKTWAGQ